MNYTRILEIGVPIVVSALIAVSSWLVISNLDWERTTNQKKKDIRVQYLISAYYNLRELEDTGIKSKDDFEKFRKIINDIYLFGTREQIEVVHQNVQGRPETFNLSGINKLIVKEIREELNLEFYPDRLGKSMSWVGDKK